MLCPPVRGQDGVIPTVDVRSRLLGGTGLNAVRLDALWTNPAGYGALSVGQFGAGAGAEQRWGLSQLRYVNAGGVYGTGFGGFGFQLASFGFDGYRETRLGLGYGRRLSERLRIGAGLHGFATGTAGYAGTFDVTLDVGLQLVISKQLSVGARVFSPFRVERTAEEYSLQLIGLGLAYTPTNQLKINVEAHQNTEYPLRARVGLEYLPDDAFSIRLGVVTAASELSFGLGYVVFPGVEITAGAGWHETLGFSPGFGLRWQPSKPKDDQQDHRN